ncbi:hypothetical protein KPL74_18440 [Bacillus sp. NP157]|nr:hypothetical protein KPL74_18440 [Bacillus sp. NP157]
MEEFTIRVVPIRPEGTVLKIEIDFSIFDSPTTAYGMATGTLDVPSLPVEGDRLQVSGARGAICVDGFDGCLKVEHLVAIERTGRCIFMLSDVVTESRADAELLHRRLEAESDVFVDEY